MYLSLMTFRSFTVLHPLPNTYNHFLSLPKSIIMTLQRYPIGLQDFSEVVNRGCVYVDKTFFAHQLITTYKYYFLSRPRRFGKSLFVSTLEYLFKGHQELFEGLYIADKWKFEEYPVIKISFSNIGYREIALEKAIAQRLNDIAHQYELSLQSTSASLQFKELIQLLQEKFQQKVVVLIDEYDKPLIDYLDKENLHKAQENRAVLKSFYSILKDADPYLKLVFITGISKFSQVSIFSDLNNLYDISLKEDFNEICGISQAEIDQYFPEELKKYDRQKIRTWYNGYRWNVKGDSLYNPFSILNFFSGGGDFVNFWYSTGTPTFLVKMCREQKLYELKDLRISEMALNSFSIENLQVLPVLFQTGYLTITDYDPVFSSYRLGYPNKEVKSSYVEGLLELYSYSHEPMASALLNQVLNALQQQSAEELKEALNQAFSHIPYDLWQKDNEHFYHAIVHLLFSLMGVYIHSEVHTHKGRADALVMYEDHIYCLEFKLDKSAQEALEQIETRGYMEQYRASGKQMHRIGINFSSEKKAVEEIVWERLEANNVKSSGPAQ